MYTYTPQPTHIDINGQSKQSEFILAVYGSSKLKPVLQYRCDEISI